MAKMLPQTDPNVKTPAAVRAAAARADELHEAEYGKAPDKIAEPLDQVVTPVEPIVKPDVKADATLTPIVVVEPPVEPVVVTPVAPKPPVDDKSMEHKYNSMKGRHDQLANQLRTMSQELANAQELLANRVAPLAPAPVPAELDAKSLLTQEQRTEYGDEFLDVVGRKARETLNPEVVALRAQVAKLTQQVDHVGTTINAGDRRRYFTDLNRIQPGWEAVNNDPNFLNWLALPDTYSGAIRHELLKAAYDKCDAFRVSAFFQGFLAEEAATAPRDPAPDLTAPPIPEPKVPLESFAAPGRAKTTATTPSSVPAEKPIYTERQVADFYVEVRRGAYRGNEAEKARIEALIIEAARDRRIR